jgi:hypothetical protein
MGLFSKFHKSRQVQVKLSNGSLNTDSAYINGKKKHKSDDDDDENDDRLAGQEFCSQHVIFTPTTLNTTSLHKLTSGSIRLITPPLLNIPTNSIYATEKRFKGELQQPAVESKKSTSIKIKSKKDCKECVYISDVPLYASQSFKSNKIYFEVKITSLKDSSSAAIAVGFTCLPYPPFRLPGMHRGSIAVLSSDGELYINGTTTSKVFTKPFQEGQVIGIGLNYATKKLFFTRDGSHLREHLLAHTTATTRDYSAPARNTEYRAFKDTNSISVLCGDYDVYAAIGFHGQISMTINFCADGPFRYPL